METKQLEIKCKCGKIHRIDLSGLLSGYKKQILRDIEHILEKMGEQK